MVACLLTGDAMSLSLSAALAVFIRLAPNHFASWHSYISLAPLLPVFLLVYGAMGLYSGISLGSPEELRRLTLASTLVSLFLGVLTLSTRGTNTIFTWTMAMALVTSIILVPVTRGWMRHKFALLPWWGYPTVVFGDHVEAEGVIRNLVEEPGLGLKPVGLYSPSLRQERASGVPVIGEQDMESIARTFQGPAYAVLATSSETRDEWTTLVRSYRRYFTHMLVVPDLPGFSCLWVNPKNLGGILGLEVCQQVFVPSRRILKRAIDLCLTAAASAVFLPLSLLIILAIKIGSPGPVFYAQRRIGRGGREFRAWKFRSMVTNADAILKNYLENNPEMASEWQRNHKLKNDPRITRIGRFLRATSLDEIPQLWNIIRGDMSLVGPRPIVREEIHHYGEDFETYTWVPGGLTGLWQVSGRSATSYQQRVNFDRFYVHNWSVWLDFCILFRTIGIVLSRSGAF
jgi:Undecaprenyl-phosphate galactose phosphotransferase WbaP